MFDGEVCGVVVRLIEVLVMASFVCDYCGGNGKINCQGLNCQKRGVKKTSLCNACKKKHGTCRFCKVVAREHEQTVRMRNVTAGTLGLGVVGKENC